MVQIQSRDAAVSPVIGVLLMLVVTIIVAAVISAFAGGLAGGTDKAPQIALEGKLRYEGNLTLTHKGGDPLPWQNVEIRIYIPSGPNKDMTWSLNLDEGWYIPSTAQWIRDTTLSPPNVIWAPAFRPGDEVTFNWYTVFDPNDIYAPHTPTPSTLPVPVLDYSPMPGEPIDVQFYDKVSGKMILSTRIITI